MMFMGKRRFIVASSVIVSLFLLHLNYFYFIQPLLSGQKQDAAAAASPEEKAVNKDKDKIKQLESISDPNDRRNAAYTLPGSMEQYSLQLERFIVTALPPRLHKAHLASLRNALTSDVQHDGKDQRKVIFQTGREIESTPLTRSWVDRNSEFSREFLDDSAADLRIKSALDANVLWDVYSGFDRFVMKADFLRYALMYFEGGVYSDMDTKCLKPIRQWDAIPEGGANTNVILGIEIDASGREDWFDWYRRPLQMIQWTLVSLHPRHPIYLDVLRRIYDSSKKAQELSSLRAEKTDELRTHGLDEEAEKVISLPDDENIMEITGPGAFTDSVMAFLKVKFNASWTDFRELEEPIRFGDVTILPITSFSPGTGAGTLRDELAYVQHTFEGSWRQGKDS